MTGVQLENHAYIGNGGVSRSSSRGVGAHVSYEQSPRRARFQTGWCVVAPPKPSTPEEENGRRSRQRTATCSSQKRRGHCTTISLRHAPVPPACLRRLPACLPACLPAIRASFCVARSAASGAGKRWRRAARRTRASGLPARRAGRTPPSATACCAAPAYRRGAAS